MGKIKGWKKVKNKEYSIYSNNKINKILAVNGYNDNWGVEVGKTNSVGAYLWLGNLNFKGTKKQAKKFAIDYMRSHPNG